MTLNEPPSFKRINPKTDRFVVHRFHSIEFWCNDATNTYKRFQHALGMSLVAKSGETPLLLFSPHILTGHRCFFLSDQSTGNTTFASYCLRSNDLVFTFTAPYSRAASKNGPTTVSPLPHYDQEAAHAFVSSHGLAVRAVSLSVQDAHLAFHTSVVNGAIPVLPPTTLTEEAEGKKTSLVVAEVKLYGDVVLRFISPGSSSSEEESLLPYEGPYLPNYQPVLDAPLISYGITRLDHAVGNVPDLAEAVKYISGFTGFHEFAEFTAEDVGTLDSGLNSLVLASDNELVLLPINEPTHGTPRKSQIQTFLEQNEGPGLQHLALKTNDIFKTLREMQKRSTFGGFEFMPRPSDKYYKNLPEKVGGALTAEQYALVEEMGILVDVDDQGVLLQIFTKPLGDRPTVFIEIIERVGCLRRRKLTSGDEAKVEASMPLRAVQGMEVDAIKDGSVVEPVVEQAAGCGGFGKGNFSELFKRIEDYERTLSI
jgi:4-hydroxyphenylpyruvate dioxygenase